MAFSGNPDYPHTRTPVSSVDTASPSPADSGARYVTQKIRDLPTGTWVLADNPETDVESDFGHVVPGEWRRLLLQMVKEDGGTLDIELLRPLWWMAEYGATRAGAIVELDLEELGAAGPAEVRDIGPCPPVQPRPSARHRLVTGKFIHSSANILELHVEGLSEPIGVTASHPFWSEDRQQFIAAAELDADELILSAYGTTTRVLSVAARNAATEPVYNLEVDGEHVYYVADCGLLVHNACTKEIRRALNQPKGGGAAHHIVAADATNMHALEARDYLARAGISPESYWNGVMLDKSLHNVIHTDKYYRNGNRSRRVAAICRGSGVKDRSEY